MDVSPDTLVRVLLSLYRSGEKGIAAMEIVNEAGCALRDVMPAVEELRRRDCLIEEVGDKLVLTRTGLSCWTDVIESGGAKKETHARGDIGNRAIVYASTASTNDLCWSICGTSRVSYRDHGTVVLADHQLAGRGRRGNRWIAAAGQSILMSVFISHGGGIEGLTLLAGLAAAEGIEAALGSSVKTEIKWPNDVLIGGKKVAGVLAETRKIEFESAAVLGIGVNVGQTLGDFPQELRARATSCFLATGKMPDRLRIIEGILDALDRHTFWGGDNWLPMWKARCAMLGQRVALESAGVRFNATIVDVDPLHGLVVRDDTGTMRFLPSATTTLSPQ